jgi:hypothetical protein
MIKMWKWCELWLRKTAVRVSGWLQDRRLITPATKVSRNDFENGSSESTRTLQMTGCCTTITRQLTLRFQLGNFWWRKNIPVLPTSSLQPRSNSLRILALLEVEIQVEGLSFLGRWKTHKTL